MASDVAMTTISNTAYKKHIAHRYAPPPVKAQSEIPSPPAPQQPAALGSGDETEWEEDVVYDVIPGDQ